MSEHNQSDERARWMEKEIVGCYTASSAEGGGANMLEQRCSFDDSILQHDLTYVKEQKAKMGDDGDPPASETWYMHLSGSLKRQMFYDGSVCVCNDYYTVQAL